VGLRRGVGVGPGGASLDAGAAGARVDVDGTHLTEVDDEPTVGDGDHGGAAKQVPAKAAIRAEVLSSGLTDATIDPCEQLLRLVTQSAARAEMSAQELKALVDESPNLREDLVAEIWVATEAGDTYKAGEYVRGLARLDAEERDRCASFCSKAVAAGLVKKQTELAQIQGEMLMRSLQAVLDKVSLTPEQKQQIKAELRTLAA
jgi:hypothetical protein